MMKGPGSKELYRRTDRQYTDCLIGEEKMRILQLMPTLAYGDAVGNDALAIHRILKNRGYETKIYAEIIDKRIPREIADPVCRMETDGDDVIIYHMSTGSGLNAGFAKMKGRKVMIYHNITPSRFFKGYNPALERLCRDGRYALQYLSDEVDYALADSEYNAGELRTLKYKCPVDVMPILLSFEDYEREACAGAEKEYRDGKTNVIFTGRIAPNKKQEDVIDAFYHYQKYYNEESRLILLGSYFNMETYYERLKDYVGRLGVKNVVFTGHVSFEEMLCCYRAADLFLCMSEHEGFCVPLVEAMYFHIPIVAYDSSAIGHTLGGSGILLKDKNPLEAAGVMDRILKDEALRKQILAGQDRRLQDFGKERTERLFMEKIEGFLKDEGLLKNEG